MRTAPFIALAAVTGAAAVPGAAYAQIPPTEDASGTIVTVIDGSEQTSVGETTATVTTGTSTNPATSDSVLITDGGTSAGAATSGATVPSATTPVSSEETDNARVRGGGTSTTPTPATTAADTAANVVIGTGRIVASEGPRKVTIRVNGSRSRAEARRRGRRMETSASTSLGATGDDPGLSVDGLVTVGTLRASSESVATRRARSRLTLRIRELRVRANEQERPVIRVHWARMRPGGSMRARITLRPARGAPVTRTIIIRRSRRGRDLLSRSTYRGTTLARAFRRLERGRLEDVETRLRAVRVGGSRTVERGRRTRARVDGLTVELRVPGSRSGAGTSQLGFVTAVVGTVASAATTAATPIVTAAQKTAELSAGLAEAVADVSRDLPGIFAGESATVSGRLLDLNRRTRTVTLMLVCAADFSGDLFLMDARNEDRSFETREAHIACRNGVSLRITIAVSARFLRLVRLPQGVDVLPVVELDASEHEQPLAPVTLVKPE